MAEETPFDRLKALADDASKTARLERVQALSNSTAHYLCVIGGVVGGALAAAAASAGWAAEISIVGGICAAIGSGLPPVLHFEQRAKGHDGNYLTFKPVSDAGKNQVASLRNSDPDDSTVATALKELQQRIDTARSKFV